MAAAREVGAEGVGRFTHGTTIATNALLERRGAKTALVTNEGFEHVLHLRRQTRAHLYRPCAAASASARAARALASACAAGRGRRASSSRSIWQPSPRSTPRRSPSRFSSRSATASPSARSRPSSAGATPTRTWSPLMRSHRSSASTSAPRRRRSTPTSGPSSRATSVRSRRHAPLPGFRSRSSCAPREASRRWTRPQPTPRSRCSRALRRVSWARRGSRSSRASATRCRSTWAARRRTSARSSTAVAQREHERLVGGLPVRLPTLAVHTVGAGGGSIVRLDDGRRASRRTRERGRRAGACLLRARRHARDGDGRQPAPRPAARGAARRDRARPPRPPRARSRRIDPSAVIDVVNAEMVRALRVVSVEQGLDPRDFALVAFGGAGPLHACALADELGMTTVLVPAAAGVLSALGLVAADERRDSVRTLRRAARRGRPAPRRRRGGPPLRRPVVRADGPARAVPRRALPRSARARYGYADRSRPIELVAVRTADVTPAPPISVDGPTLSARGPEVLELDGATAWVPEGWAGETDAHGTLVLRRSR